MSKRERLMNLISNLLGTGRALTAAQLQERLAYPEDPVAFRRAFERDKEDLREMGVTIRRITLERDDGRLTEAYRIFEEDYYLADPGLEPEELAAINLALAGVRMDGLDGTEALWKLGGVTEAADAESPMVRLPADPRLTALFAAVSERRVVRFSYQGTPRELEPHRLGYHRGRWYLTGHDRDRGAERNFRLDRIDGPVTQGEPGGFPPATSVGALDEAAWEIGDEPPVTARLLVDADHVAWAAHHLDGEQNDRQDQPDGSAIFTIPVTNRAAFISFVLGFLDHAEILDPEDLRSEMVTWLAAVTDGGPR